jgi:site-specific recombinase XerD
MALKDGYCRLCWRQASYEVNAAGGHPRGAVSILGTGRRLAHHQLFFDRMKLRRANSPVRTYDLRGRPPNPAPAPAARPASTGAQLRLFDARRDFALFDELRSKNLANPWLVWAYYLAHRRGEARGWPRRARLAARRGLTILLSAHADGDTVRYSEMFPALRALDIPVERVAEVLDEMGVLDDDRRPSFATWLDRKLDGLAPGVHREVEAWLRALHDGGPRARARDRATAWKYLNAVRPALVAWSARHAHLREVTRDDVLAELGPLHGSLRKLTIVGLRSLFAFCKKNGTVFRNPTTRIRVGQQEYGVIQPLSSGDVDEAVTTATTPAARLVLALAAVHAARSGTICALRLDDVDLGNRRLVIAGRARPLDDLTRQLLQCWLDYRRARWPGTANPHLLVTQQTASGTSPASSFWAKKTLRGHTATLERLRVDRQLEEALVHGPDPLHLAAVFGLDSKTAVRYANSARQLLETAAERGSLSRRNLDVGAPQ